MWPCRTSVGASAGPTSAFVTGRPRASVCARLDVVRLEPAADELGCTPEPLGVRRCRRRSVAWRGPARPWAGIVGAGGPEARRRYLRELSQRRSDRIYGRDPATSGTPRRASCPSRPGCARPCPPRTRVSRRIGVLDAIARARPGRADRAGSPPPTSTVARLANTCSQPSAWAQRRTSPSGMCRRSSVGSSLAQHRDVVGEDADLAHRRPGGDLLHLAGEDLPLRA